MYVSTVFASICLLVLASGIDARSPKPLTKEQIERISKWTPEEQNAWQLSGQFEGDIVLSPGNRNGVIDTRYRWPQATLVYEFDGAISQSERDLIRSSLDDYTRETCVRHKERTYEDNYIYVTNDNSGCWSMVGCQGGRQTLNLQANGCMWKGTIIHEFKHALGFWHQQSATERDDYVTIMWQNIQSGTEGNFDKYDSNYITNFGTIYDYGSIMHYDAYAFSANGEKTIVTHNGAAIGQNDGLSPTDTYKVNMMYCW